MANFKKIIPKRLINYGKHLPEAVLANLKYGFPGRKLKVIGVTGTDGKTTTVNMIYKILKDAWKKVSMVSTINAEIAGKKYETGFHVTSPHSSMIQDFLSQAVENGDEYFILEVTSHALEQFRVWGIPFVITVVTNVTPEHLDYHGTFIKYLNAKAKLIKNAPFVVLNRDDNNFETLKSKTSGKVVTFGIHLNSTLNPQNFPLKLKIPGKFNILNAEAAALVAQQLGISNQVIKKSLEGFINLSGRMEEVKNNKGLKIIIDFAHTPNALENALLTLKSETKGKLISVFGCASERDTKKRPIMGAISAKIADLTILTDEDPRFENSLDIIESISRGSLAHGAKLNTSLFKEPDRFKAISLAISQAKKNDTVGIFGKGHEKSMNYKGNEIPWSDTQAVRRVLNGRQD